MNLRGRIAQNLRRLWLEKGWSQEVLSERVGMDRAYVSALERSTNAATVDMLEKLASALGVEPVDLLDYRDAARSKK